MKLSNLEMSEKSIDVQENDMLLAEVRHQPAIRSERLKFKAMFTRDRFQMVPFQKSCRIGLLFTRDLLTVPSIRSRSGPKTGPPKKQVQFLEPFRSQTDPSPCKHLDRFVLADPSPCKHLDRFLLVLRRHFESYNVYSAHA